MKGAIPLGPPLSLWRSQGRIHLYPYSNMGPVSKKILANTSVTRYVCVSALLTGNIIKTTNRKYVNTQNRDGTIKVKVALDQAMKIKEECRDVALLFI